MEIQSLIRTIPDYPKPGILFRDVTSLLRDKAGFKTVVDRLTAAYRGQKFDHVVGIEARGFILGGALAYALDAGFIPIRKKGKLPGEKLSQSYDLEYGTDTIEIHRGDVKRGDRVLLVDDLLATGGTALGAIKLLKALDVEVKHCAFIIDLPDLGGRRKLEAAGCEVQWLTQFSGH